MGSKKFAVLVINFNGEKFIRACFDSLVKIQQVDNCFDIYLLDNNSTDKSVDLAQKYSEVQIIQIGKNLGFSGAYNFAHKNISQGKIKYDYYLILNNDTIASDGEIFKRAEKIFAEDKNIGIINPTVLNRDGTIQFQTGNFYFLSGTTISFNRGQYKKLGQLSDSQWATGSALFIRTKLFEQVGGFDDYFMYMEDVGLSWKVLNFGYRVVCDFGSSIIHIHDGTKKTAHFSHFYAERNRLLMYWQNLSSLVFVCFLPFFILTRLIVILGWFILKDRNAKIALARFRGLLLALCLLGRFPKHSHSVTRDFNTIRYFYTLPKISRTT